MEPEPPRELPVHVGTMGWGYADWSGVFYPTEAASKDYITYYAQEFDAVEIDSTFYGTPREAQVRQWKRQTPAHFRFCPKAPRTITHEMRLIDATGALAEFVRVMGLLREKCGPILLQMPPDFTRAELGSLERFLPTLRTLPDTSLRFAIEFRHRSLIGQDVSALLKEHRVALAITDYPAMPKRFEITTDFLYMRMIGRHGAFPEHRALQADHTESLKRWTEAVRQNASQVGDIYAFMNNDYEGFAPETAEKFKTLLGLPVSARPQPIQGSLF